MPVEYDTSYRLISPRVNRQNDLEIEVKQLDEPVDGDLTT